MGFIKTKAQRKATIMLGGNAIHNMLDGGSRSGKTFLLVRSIIIRALKVPNTRHCMLRKHFSTIKRAIWFDTLPKVLDLCFEGLHVDTNKSDWYLKFHNGSEIWFGGLDDKERTEKILGNEYSTIYFNEASELTYDAVTIALTRLAQKSSLTNKIYYDCNPPGKKHWLYKLFFEGKNPISNVAVNPSHYARMRMNPYDNEENLADGYIETILEGLPERKRARFLKGEWLDDLEGALWDRSTIDSTRVLTAPDMKRVYIGVDPAVTAKDTSDNTGIVAVGQAENGHFYVMRDYSMEKASPFQWGKRVDTLYQELQADKVIGEVNNGGDLVESNLRHVNRFLNYKSAHASRGKFVRAEPIAGLYEQGKVHHIGIFPELEDEMCNYNPDNEEGMDKSNSPDRMDALVWALTELAGKSKRAGVW